MMSKDAGCRQRSVRRVVGLAAVGGVLAAAPAAVAAPIAPVTDFAVPTANADPQGIATAPDGSIWFAEHGASRIGRVTAQGSVVEYPTVTPDAAPESIAVASDGSVWFTEPAVDKIGEYSPSAGTTTEYSVPGGAPAQITIGPDDDAWFTEPAANRIGTVKRDGTIDEYPVPTADSRPEGITTASAGTILFAEAAPGAPPSDLGRYRTITTGGAITEQLLPTTIGGTAITTDAAGDAWLAMPGGNGVRAGALKLGAGTGTGEVFFDGDSATSIAIGADGAAWLTQPGSGQLTRATPGSAPGVTPYAIQGAPQDIVAGPDSTLWFTDSQADAIGRIAMTAPAITTSAAASATAGQAVSIPVTTSGFPAPALRETGALPSGLSLTDNGDGSGTIAGTPAASAAGSYPVTITAASGFGDSASEQLTITVTAPAAVTPPTTTIATTPTTTTTSARATLRLAKRAAVTRRRVASVKLSCADSAGQSCTGTLTLTTKVRKRLHRHGRVVSTTRTVTLGQARYRLTSGATTTLRVRLSVARYRLLESARGHTLTATIRARATAGTAPAEKLKLAGPKPRPTKLKR